MGKLIDLSHTIKHDMAVYPGDEPVILKQNKFYKKDYYNNFILSSGLHIGTHIDTPMHMSEDKLTIDEYPLNQFYGNGVLINAYQEKIVSYKEEYDSLVQENDIVLIYTGHSEYYGMKNYYEDYPILSERLIHFLIEKKVKLIGVDTPSPDKPPFLMHQELFKHHILLIENLCNLNKLINVKKFEVFSFPLKIKADASLLRVVAKISE
ncbi:cyclase family protein [Mycoplasmatota bacterium]|nr:cyclase family protein [Mycoplasmatota bacterium]